MDCGVELASESDPKKAFSASQTGEVFGVEYDTVEFTWWLREDKLAVIINMLLMVEQTDRHKIRFLKAITGKLVHYRQMVPLGKFHLGQLIRMSIVGEDKNMEKVVTVTDWAREEAWFWRNMLPFCSKRTVLPDPDYCLPDWTMKAHTDAAGGTVTNSGYGVGAVLGEHWWAYLPWGEAINEGRQYSDGQRLSNKMSAWELLGLLLVLTARVDLVRNKSLIVPEWTIMEVW